MVLKFHANDYHRTCQRECKVNFFPEDFENRSCAVLTIVSQTPQHWPANKYLKIGIAEKQ